MKRRILSVLLALTMLLGLVPTTQAVSATTHNSHPVCGAACSGHTESHGNVTWTAFPTGTTTLSGGSYYLTGDISGSTSITISGEVNLCLNGHLITNSAGSGITVNSGATLNLCDCAGGGPVNGGNANYGIKNSGIVNMYGGTVTGSYGIYNSSSGSVTVNGGAVTGKNGYGISSTGTVTVNGGAVTGNTYQGIYSSGGTITVTGGIITGNNQGIYGSGSVTLTVTGGTITGNSDYGIKYENKGTFTLGGSPAISGTTAAIYLGKDKTVTVDSGGLTGGPYSVAIPSSVTPTEATPVAITAAASADYSGHFTSADASYSIRNSGSDSDQVVQLYVPQPHSHPVCGAACAGHTESHEAVDFTALDAAPTDNKLNDGSYYLTGDISGSTLIKISGEVNLCLNGHSITNSTGSGINVSSTGTLHLCDCAGGGSVTSGNSYGMSTSGSSDNYGTLIMYGGSVTVTGTNKNGILFSGNVTVYGGSIEGTQYGIYNQGNTLTLGGSPTISGVTADIYLSSGKKITVDAAKPLTGVYSVLTNDNNNKPTANSPVTIATAADGKDYSGCFTPAPGKYAKVVHNGDGNVVLRLLEVDVGGTVRYPGYTTGKLTTADLTTPEARTGYIWDGWYTAETGGAKVTVGTVFTDDATLYPRWTVCTHSGNTNTKTTVDATCTDPGSETYTCSKCNLTVTTVKDALGHSYATAWSKDADTHYHVCQRTGCGIHDSATEAAHTPVAIGTAVAATCNTAGMTAGSKCDLCGYVIEAQTTIPATGKHTPVTDAAVAATCTTAGKTEGSHCDLCGTVLVAQTTVAAKGHTVVTDAAVAPTCTATGLTEGSHCSVCSYVIKAQTTVAATDHTWGTWTITANPTTEATGTAERVCENDGTHKDTGTVPVLTDTTVWTAGARVDPTEDAEGSQVYTSEYGTVTVTIPALDHTHTWGAWTITANPTTEATGTAERVCTKNSDHKDTFTLPVLTDTSVWTAGEKTEPTEDADGSQTYTSDIYGTVTVTIPATGHTHSHAWSADWTTNATHHWHECEADGCDITENSGKDGYGAHSYNGYETSATQHWQVCACGYETAKTDHDWTDDQDTTCNTCGYTRTVAPVFYTVTFNANGGSAVAFQQVESGDQATQPTDPTKEGFTFKGWYSDTACTTAWDFSTAVTKSMTLYAKWEKNPAKTYTVTFDAQGGEPAPGDKTVTEGKLVVPKPPALTKEGYDFKGWYTEAGVLWNFATDTVSGDMTLTAKWEAKSGGTPVTEEPVELPDGGSVTKDPTTGDVTITPPDGEGGTTITITPPSGEDGEDVTVDTNTGEVTVPGGSTVDPGNGTKIELPDGGKVDGEGNITLPDGGDAITIPDGEGGSTTITAPDGGGTIKPTEDGGVEIPGGSTVKTGEDSPEVTVGDEGGKVDDSGNITVPGGSTVTIPDGEGGKTEITVPSGGEGTITPTEDGKVEVPTGSTIETSGGGKVTIDEGAGTVAPDGTVTLPDGGTVTVTTPDGQSQTVEVPAGGTVDPATPPAPPTPPDTGEAKGEVEVKPNTPAVTVDDTALQAVAEGEKEEGQSVTVKLVVEKQTEPDDKAELEAVITGKKDDVLYLDLTLLKQVNDEEPESIPDTQGKVLEIIVPYDFTGKKDITVYRKHGGEDAQALTQASTKADGTYRLVGTGASGKVYIYASKFSTYAIAYTAETTTPTPSHSSSRPSTYSPTIQQPEHGKVSVSPSWPEKGDKVTVTVTPDKGYEVDTITVTDRNGKSVEVTKNPDGTYSFTQPTGKVTVSAVMKAAKTVCPKDGTCPISKFTDASATAWYHDGVHYCVEHGLMVGTSQTTFAPTMDTSRAMIATILWRLAGSPDPKQDVSFPDCVAGSWYAKAVAWATEAGVVKGYGNSNFGPDDPITREQLAAMLYRYAGSPATSGTLDGFTDSGKAGSWATDALRWAVEQGILTGKGGGVLDPAGHATRAEAAAMLVRFVALMK